jgi:tetraacyldisaccharide 4'-kinase
VLTRGYGGTARGILRADPARHTATDIGDEALLLAQRAPVWVGADRAEAARAAIAAGAEALVMDDGLQNPSLEKDIAFLVVDGAAGFGNGRVIPAGPLREPPQAAAARATACVMIGADDTGAASHLPSQLPILRARLVPGAEIAECAGAAVLAFAGIGRPEKFFTMLEQAGVVIRRRIPFPDHFAYTPAQLARLRREAAALGARAVTTPKDFMRIPAMARAGITPIGVSLAWEDEEALSALLEGRKDVLF